VRAHCAAFAVALLAACVAFLSPATSRAQSATHTGVIYMALLATQSPAPPSKRPDSAHGAVHARTPTPAWAAFTRAWAAIEGYNATVTVFERKASQVQNMVLNYTFRKPSNATVRIIQGPNAGVTLRWTGGTTLVAHRGSGLMAIFTRTLSLHDPLAMTIRGSSIDQLSFGAILVQAQHTLGTVSQRPGEVIKGVATDAVRLIASASVSNVGLTLQVVEISKTTQLPVRMLGYEGQTLVRRIDFSNVKLEANSGAAPSVRSLPSPIASPGLSGQSRRRLLVRRPVELTVAAECCKRPDLR
jgi:hypothetical protein